jgi:hypothetical protein
LRDIFFFILEVGKTFLSHKGGQAIKGQINLAFININSKASLRKKQTNITTEKWNKRYEKAFY